MSRRSSWTIWACNLFVKRTSASWPSPTCFQRWSLNSLSTSPCVSSNTLSDATFVSLKTSGNFQRKKLFFFLQFILDLSMLVPGMPSGSAFLIRCAITHSAMPSRTTAYVAKGFSNPIKFACSDNRRRSVGSPS